MFKLKIFVSIITPANSPTIFNNNQHSSAGLFAKYFLRTASPSRFFEFISRSDGQSVENIARQLEKAAMKDSRALRKIGIDEAPEEERAKETNGTRSIDSFE